MTVGFQILMDGLLANDDAAGTLLGSTENPAVTEATLLGTLSRTQIDSFEGVVLYYWFRVKLDGVFVPESDLIGPLVIRRNIDSHTVSWSFGLAGPQYSIFKTETTWIRTAVEVETYHGQSHEIQSDLPRISGYILTCNQVDDNGPVMLIECADQAALYERSTTCREYDPFSGNTRGDIVEDLLTDAGITDFVVPAGEVYNKQVQANSRRLFEFIKEFVLPEGWLIRFQPSGRLVLSEPRLKLSPQAPDAIWTRSDWYDLKVIPPANPPSRWVVRGTTALMVDELGVETRITKTEIIAPYAPVIATDMQDTSGVITPSGATPIDVEDRLISRVIDEQTSIGGKLLTQVTRQWGFYNPQSALQVSSTSPPADYDFVNVLLNADGQGVQFLFEKFLLISKRVTVNVYDVDENLVSSIITSSRYKLRVQGVADQNSNTTDNPDVNGTFIHSDGQGYLEQNEVFERAEEQRLSFEFDENTGAQSRTVQETFRYYEPRCRTDGGAVGGWFLLRDGSAMTGLTENFILVETKTTDNILSNDGALLGQIDVNIGFGGPAIRHDGNFEWGGQKSDSDNEEFRLISTESRQFNILSEDQVEEVRFSSAGRESRTVLGGSPLPVFLNSAWTRLRTEPLEIILDDATVDAWFGFERRVMNNPYIQTEAEGEKILETLRERILARKIEISRPLTIVKEGDTVLLIDPEHGLSHRCLVRGIQETWTMTTGEVTALYRLEANL